MKTSSKVRHNQYEDAEQGKPSCVYGKLTTKMEVNDKNIFVEISA